jgi:hypothetical protein
LAETKEEVERNEYFYVSLTACPSASNHPPGVSNKVSLLQELYKV